MSRVMADISDGLFGVAASEADVVEPASVSDGEFAVAVDAVAVKSVAVNGDSGEVRAVNASSGVRRLMLRCGRVLL